MSESQQEKIGQNILIKLAMLVIILSGIRGASDILVPLLLAAFFAIVLNPLVTILMRHGLRRGVAITLVITVILFVILLLVAVIASSVSEFYALYPQIRAPLEHKMSVVQQLATQFHINVSTDSLVQRFDPSMMMNLATSALSQFSGAMTRFVLLILTVVFMLFEVHHLPYKMRNSLVNPKIRIAGLHKALKGVTHYPVSYTHLTLPTTPYV